MGLVRPVLILATVLLPGACWAQASGDFDGDGRVTSADLAHFNRAWALSHQGAGFDPRCDFENDGKVDTPDARIITAQLARDDSCDQIITADLAGTGDVTGFPDTLAADGAVLELRATGAFASGTVTHLSPIGCAAVDTAMWFFPGWLPFIPAYWMAQVTIPPNARTDGAPQIHLLTLDMKQAGGALVRAFEERAIRVAAPGTAAFDADVQEALDFWNAARAGAGVQPLALDPDAHNGHQLHAHYIAVNGMPAAGTPHDEEPGKPCYSNVGQRYAQKSNIAVSTWRRSQREATEGLLDAPIHRVRMLEPALFATGMGWELRSGAGTTSVSPAQTMWECVVSQDVLSNRDGTPYTQPIRYPHDGQTGVSPSWAFNEAGLDQIFPGITLGTTVGYPITLQWGFWSEDISDVSGSLTRLGAGGGAVATRIANAQDTMPAEGVIILLPTASLQTSAEYETTIRCRRAGGPLETYTWRFTTAATTAGTLRARGPWYLPRASAPPRDG